MNWKPESNLKKRCRWTEKVAVSGLNTVHTLDDMTLGSVKGGVSYRVNDRINVFGNVGWLFGSDYENVSANFGLNYAF